MMYHNHQLPTSGCSRSDRIKNLRIIQSSNRISNHVALSRRQHSNTMSTQVLPDISSADPKIYTRDRTNPPPAPPPPLLDLLPLPLAGLFAMSLFKCCMTVRLVSRSASNDAIVCCSSAIFFSLVCIAARAISRPLRIPCVRRSWRLRTAMRLFSVAGRRDGRIEERILSASRARGEGSSAGRSA